MTASPAFPVPPDLLGARAASSRGGVLFTLACVAVALWDLGGRSLLDHDVSRFAAIARDMLRTGDLLVPVRDGEVYVNKPVLYPWAVALFSWLAGGVTELTTRLPSALALVGMAHATAAWGAFRTGSAAVGRIAGLLLLTTFFVHALGRASRPDLLAAAFSTWAAYRLDRACAGGGTRADPVVAGLALGAGMLAKGPPILLLPLFVVALPRAGVPWRERVARARPLLVLLLALAVPALWVVPAWLRAGGDFFRRLVVDQVATRVAGEANHEEAPWYYLVSWWVGALPWSPLLALAGLSFLSRGVRARLRGGAHAAAAGATFLAFSAFPTKETRYLAPVVPPLCVAAAQWVPVLAHRMRRPRAWTLALRVAGLAVVAAAVLAAVRLLPLPGARPWVAPPLALLVLFGAGALLVPRGERSTLPLVGRAAGLVVGTAALALCLYWAGLPRSRTVERDLENAAVGGALESGVPTFLVGGSEEGRVLTPENLFYGVRDGRYVRDAASLPTRAEVPDAQVVLMDSELEAARARRGPLRVLLRRPRRGGGDLLVVR